MQNNDDKENDYLSSKAFPLAMLKSNASKYEAYIRNVLQEDFENETEMFNKVGEYITNIKK